MMKGKTYVLKLSQHDPEKEREFELRFLRSLSIQQRFRLVQNASRVVRALLIQRGHRRPSEIIASLDDLITMKRAAGRAKDREDLKYLLKLKKRK